MADLNEGTSCADRWATTIIPQNLPNYLVWTMGSLRSCRQPNSPPLAERSNEYRLPRRAVEEQRQKCPLHVSLYRIYSRNISRFKCVFLRACDFAAVNH